MGAGGVLQIQRSGRGNEFAVVAGRQAEAAMLPSRPRARPPARRRSAPCEEATKFHQMKRGPSIVAPPSSISRAPCAARLDRDPVAGAEDQHPAGLEGLAADADLALQDIDPAILVVVRQRDGGAGGEARRRRRTSRTASPAAPSRPRRCRGSAGPPCPRPPAPAGVARATWTKAAGVVLAVLRQGEPGLQAEQRHAAPARAAPSVRSEWVIPCPAIIQFTAPGSIHWSVPRLSR